MDPFSFNIVTAKELVIDGVPFQPGAPCGMLTAWVPADRVIAGLQNGAFRLEPAPPLEVSPEPAVETPAPPAVPEAAPTPAAPAPRKARKSASEAAD